MSGCKRRTGGQLFAAIVLEVVLMAILVVVLQPKLVGNPRTDWMVESPASPVGTGGADNPRGTTRLLADAWHVATAVQSPRPLNRWTASVPSATLTMDPPASPWKMPIGP